MTRRNQHDDWVSDELLPRLKSKNFIGATVFWLVIWAICNFEPWVGFGLMFAWAGSVGLMGGGKGALSDLDDEDDDRGYQKPRGSETPEQARARLGEASLPAPEDAPATPALYRAVLIDAAPARARLEAAASVAEGELGQRLRRMSANTHEVARGLEADPARLSDVQRLFTYYVPATADLLSARGEVARAGDTTRLGEIDAMIGKLDVAFADFAQRLKGHDARSLEIDMRLLDQSLADEFAHKPKG
jgi:hypothetical protein